MRRRIISQVKSFKIMNETPQPGPSSMDRPTIRDAAPEALRRPRPSLDNLLKNMEILTTRKKTLENKILFFDKGQPRTPAIKGSDEWKLRNNLKIVTDELKKVVTEIKENA